MEDCLYSQPNGIKWGSNGSAQNSYLSLGSVAPYRIDFGGKTHSLWDPLKLGFIKERPLSSQNRMGIKTSQQRHRRSRSFVKQPAK